MKAIDVANWFISKANSEKLDDNISEGVSNLKLQKVLYFAQAAHLALYSKKPLFEDDILAWPLGPVVNEVYHKFKTAENQPIPKPSNDDYKKFDAKLNQFLENVWSLFGKFSAAKLVQMSHDHKPWKDAIEDNREVITKQEIYDYYKSAFQEV